MAVEVLFVGATGPVFSVTSRSAAGARCFSRRPIGVVPGARRAVRAATRISASSGPLQTFTTLFPVWSLGAAAVGIAFPGPFAAVPGSFLTLALGLLMLSMGLTLSPSQLLEATTKWRALLLCFIGCYVVMPCTALALTKIFTMPRDFQVGLLLLGIVSGGQASNLCTYIARGDTALSVAMTTMTTFLAVVMLPFLSHILIGQLIPIDVVGVAKSAVQVVLLPIFLGAGINAVTPALARIEPLLPVVGILATVFIVVVSIAKTSAVLKLSLLGLLTPVVLLHVCGGLFGYFVPKMLDMGETEARTLSIETAFKSPALSYVLATKHFTDIGARVPSAVSIVALAPLVALLAVYLRSRPVKSDGATSS